MKRAEHIFLFVVAVGVLVGSIVFVLSDDPEEVLATSEDGVVTVTGRVREPSNLTIRTLPPEGGTVLVGHVYELVASSESEAPLTLTMRRAANTENALFMFDETTGMWHALDALIGEDTLRFPNAESGLYSLGGREAFMMPEFLDVFDALRAAAPAGAVGYSLLVGYAREGEPFVRIPDVGERGGCGGALYPGKEMRWSTTERVITLPMGDDQSLIPFTLRFVGAWHIDDNGCPDSLPFMSANDYGILPTSL